MKLEHIIQARKMQERNDSKNCRHPTALKIPEGALQAQKPLSLAVNIEKSQICEKQFFEFVQCRKTQRETIQLYTKLFSNRKQHQKMKDDF